MDTYVRVILLLVGMFILIGVVWDIWRRRTNNQDKYKQNVFYDDGEGQEPTAYNFQKQVLAAQQQDIGMALAEQRRNTNPNMQVAGNAVRNTGSNVGVNIGSHLGNRQHANTSAYVGMPMANRQLETIMPSDPRIVKVNSQRLGAAIAQNNDMTLAAHDFADMDDVTTDGYADDFSSADYNGAEQMAGGYNKDPVRRPQQQNNPATSNELLISLSVISRMQRGFPGYKLLKSFESAGLVYGKMHIFHRYAGAIQENPLFSVSSAVEPGIFHLDELANGFIPGVTLFMSANSKIDSNLAFDLLVRTAKQLGFSLNGELRDHNHRPLTVQTIERYRSMVMAHAAEYA